MCRVKCGRGFVNMRETVSFEITKDTSVVIREEPDMSSHHLSLAIVINKDSAAHLEIDGRGASVLSLPLLKKNACEIGQTLIRLGTVVGNG